MICLFVKLCCNKNSKTFGRYCSIISRSFCFRESYTGILNVSKSDIRRSRASVLQGDNPKLFSVRGSATSYIKGISLVQFTITDILFLLKKSTFKEVKNCCNSIS